MMAVVSVMATRIAGGCGGSGATGDYVQVKRI